MFGSKTLEQQLTQKEKTELEEALILFKKADSKLNSLDFKLSLLLAGMGLIFTITSWTTLTFAITAGTIIEYQHEPARKLYHERLELLPHHQANLKKLTELYKLLLCKYGASLSNDTTILNVIESIAPLVSVKDLIPRDLDINPRILNALAMPPHRLHPMAIKDNRILSAASPPKVDNPLLLMSQQTFGIFYQFRAGIRYTMYKLPEDNSETSRPEEGWVSKALSYLKR